VTEGWTQIALVVQS